MGSHIYSQFHNPKYLILFVLGGLLFFTPSVSKAQTCTGNATAVTSQVGVTNPTNAVGVVNATNALLYDLADTIVLDLGVYLKAGATYTIVWKKNAGTTNPAMLVEESYDATTFTANGAATTVSSTSYVNTAKTVGISLMRYVRIVSQNAGDLDLDALTFTSANCSNCNVTVISAIPTACSNAKYNLAVTVNYTDPPSGNIVLAIGEGPGTLFTFTPDGNSPDTYVIPNLAANNIQNIDVKAYFANHPSCTHTLVNAYNAPQVAATIVLALTSWRTPVLKSPVPM